MSFTDCIDRHLADKKIKGKKAELAKERYANIYNELRGKGHGDESAGRLAAQMATEQMEREIIERQKRNLARLRKERQVQEEIATFKKGNPGEAAQAFVSSDDRAPFVSYESLSHRWRKRLGLFLEASIARYDAKFAGLRHPKAGQDNIIHEVFGRDTGDRSAKEMADGWTKMAQYAIRAFRLAGGSIDELEDWRFPQHQARGKMAKAGETEWVRDWMQWNDWEKSRRPDGTLIPVAQREAALRSAYWALRSDGATKIDTNTGRIHRKALGNQMESHRFLHPVNSDAWLAMHNKYGEGTVYNAMVEHMERLSHKIAMVERFGPNPQTMKEFITNNAKAMAAEASKADPSNKGLIDATERSLEKFDRMWKIASRENLMVDSSRLGVFMAGARHLTISALLGSVPLVSTGGDAATVALTKSVNKMSGTHLTKTFFNLFFNNRELAKQTHVLVEDGIAETYARARYDVLETMNAKGSAISRRIADVVLRASLLVPLTRAMRQSFQAEWMGWMAREAGKEWDATDMRASMMRHGITKGEWDVMRTVPAFEYREGTKFLRPDDLLESPHGMAALTQMVKRELGTDELPSQLLVEQRAQQLADKFMVMLIDESRFAVPDATIRAAATLKGNAKSGTLGGEILNSFALMKNFPVTMQYTHLRRGMLQNTNAGRFGYLASLFVMMTGVGALSVQMRNLRDGKDPEPMNTPTFAFKSMLSGGGLGIWGDFIFDDYSRSGGTITETFAGPTIELLGRIVKFGVGNAREALEGKETKVLSDLVALGRTIHPGNNLWYAKLLLQNLVWDQIQKTVDPKAHSKWRAKQTKARNKGQNYWWAPGASTPSRLPGG